MKISSEGYSQKRLWMIIRFLLYFTKNKVFNKILAGLVKRFYRLKSKQNSYMRNK